MKLFAVQPLAPRFVAAGGGMLGLLSAVNTALWEARSAGDLRERIIVWIGLNACAVAVTALAVAGLSRMLSRRPIGPGQGARAAALSYGSYAIAGLAGGIARRALGLTSAFELTGDWPWRFQADVVSVVLAALLIGFLANQFFAHDAEIRRQQRELRDQVEKLRESRRTVVASEERLRQEIAEVLHGRVQTRLLVAWHRLGECERLLATNPAGAATVLTQARDLIDQIRERDVRDASHLLHPSIIRIGLVAAIRSLMAQRAGPLAITITVDPRVAELDDPAQNLLPAPLRLAAYRIVEESLGNVHRHAAATEVAIWLGLTPEGELDLTVRDNGRGFDTVHTNHGLGLGSIAAWAGQVDGAARVSSVVGSGTELRVLLPIAGGQPRGGPDDSPAVAPALTARAAETGAPRRIPQTPVVAAPHPRWAKGTTER